MIFMTVSELIYELEQANPDAIVTVRSGEDRYEFDGIDNYEDEVIIG